MDNRIKLVLIFLTTSGLLISIYGQLYQTINYNNQNNLNSNTVHCAKVDNQGFLWIGTKTGLTKLDQNFTTYTTNDNLPDNDITCLDITPKDEMLIGTQSNGFCIFTNGEIKKYNSTNGLISNSVNQIYYSPKHDVIIVLTDSGVSILKNNLFTNFPVSIEKNKKWFFQETESSILFSSFNSNTYTINLEKNSVTTSILLNEKSILTTIDNGDRIYQSQNTLYVKDKDNKKPFYQLSIISNCVDMINEPDGSIWFASKYNITKENDGLYLFKRKKLLFIAYKKIGITSQKISFVYYHTPDQCIIIGTEDQGIYIFNSQNFTQFPINISAKNKDSLLALSANKCQPKNNQQIFDLIKLYSKKTIPTNCYCLSFSDGMKLFDCLNINPLQTNSLHKDSLRIFCLKNNTFACANKKEIAIYNTITKHKIASASFSWKVDKVIQTENGWWIFSVVKGLYFLNLKNRISTVNIKNSYHKTPINCIEILDDYSLLLSDISGHILYTTFHNDNLNIIEKWEVRHDFPGNNIEWLVKDNNGRIWIGTDYGLTCLTLRKNGSAVDAKFTNWNDRDGYNAIVSTDAAIDKIGRIMVVSDYKLTLFDPNIILTSNKKPTIQLNQILKTNPHHQWIPDDVNFLPNINSNNKFIFRSTHNSISLNFECLNLVNRSKINYQYRLLPDHHSYNQPSRQSNIVLPNLHSGNYKLLIKAYFDHNPQEYTVKEIAFAILPPWYNSTYAYIVYVGLTLLVLLFIYSSRIKKIKKNEELRSNTNDKMALLKMEALQAQMNPHFIFNALNSLQYNILENNIEHSLEFIGEFATMIRKTLDNASKPVISLSEELEYIENYLRVEQMRYLENLHYSISIDKKIDTTQLFIPPMLIQPHIENAVKYAFTSSIGYIIISFSIVQEKLLCMIEDNGIGRVEAEKNKKTNHVSKGQQITHQRFDLLNAFYKKNNEFGFEIEDIYDIGGNPSGTRVTLFFPAVSTPESFNLL